MELNRRDFLKFIFLFPYCFSKIFHKGKIRYFDFAEIEGSYREIGYKIGRYFKRNIYYVLDQRKEWILNLKEKLLTKEGQYFKGIFLREIKNFSPQFIEEVKGMALGLSIEEDIIWALHFQCELEYIKENEGCSTIYFKNEREEFLLHNEDGNKANYGKLFLIYVKPPSGVDFYSLTYPGLIPGNAPGFNLKGIFQTTNYIGSTKVYEGIPRYFLSRAILEAKDLREAEKIAIFIPKAYPCHHNLGSFEENKYISIEATPDGFEVIRPEGLYFHTNHLILKETKNYPYEEKIYREKSSISRYETIKEELENLKENLDFKSSFQILSSHKREPFSPCRHPKGEVEGQTLCTANYDFVNKKVEFYRGNPCISFKRGEKIYFGWKPSPKTS